MKARWFDLSEGKGVLELPETLGTPALELHVVMSSEGAIAWWETEQGAWLAPADVGLG